MIRFLFRNCARLKTTLGLACFLGTLCIGKGVSAQEDSSIEIPAFEQLLTTVKDGSKEAQEQAAAMLVEYPDRVSEFADPLSGLFVIPDESLNRVADAVFKVLGADAIPAVEAMYHPEKSSNRSDNEQWRKVCGAIKAIGEPGRATFEPRLLKLLDESTDTNVRTPAIIALSGLDGDSPEAMDKILRDLEHENFNVTLVALRLVIKTGPRAQPAIDAVKKLFTDGNLSQRSLASTALGAIGPTDQYDPLPELTPLLDVFYLVVRERSLTAIGLLGSHAAALEPKARLMMMDDDSNLEARSAFVLWQITGNTSDSVPRLIELSKRADFEIAALQLLGEMGSSASDALEYLCERSKNIDYSIRCESILALAQINPAADCVKSRFAELRTDPHPVVRLTVKLIEKTCQADP